MLTLVLTIENVYSCRQWESGYSGRPLPANYRLSNNEDVGRSSVRMVFLIEYKPHQGHMWRNINGQIEEGRLVGQDGNILTWEIGSTSMSSPSKRKVVSST